MCFSRHSTTSLCKVSGMTPPILSSSAPAGLTLVCLTCRGYPVFRPVSWCIKGWRNVKLHSAHLVEWNTALAHHHYPHYADPLTIVDVNGSPSRMSSCRPSRYCDQRTLYKLKGGRVLTATQYGRWTKTRADMSKRSKQSS